jgi:hypothetical protein
MTEIRRLFSPLHAAATVRAGERATRYLEAQQLDLGAPLARFANEIEATAFVKDESNPADDRANVVDAIISAYQHAPHEMWSHSLLAIFSKKLEQLAVSFRDSELEDGELAGILAMHLLKVARTLDVSNPRLLVFVRMSQYVRDSALPEIRREKQVRRDRRRSFVGARDGDESADEEPADEGMASAVEARCPPERERQRLQRVIETVRDKLNDADLALLTARSDGCLKDRYRSRDGDPEPSKDREKAYQAAKRRLHRLIPRVRKLLDEAGMLDALGPEPAVPHLSI